MRNAKHCAVCKQKAPRYHADHMHPVVPPEGWPEEVYWSAVIAMMFYGGLQALCEECHIMKTSEENVKRRAKK